MCQIQSCCGCMTLRQGTYASAITTIVLGCLEALLVILAIVLSEEVTSDLEGDSKELAGYLKIVFYITLAVIVFWIVTAILIFVGISKNSRGFLMPWIVMTSIVVAFSILGLLLSLGSIKAVFATGQTVVNFLLQIAIVVVFIYGLICVHCFYKNDLQETQGVVAGKV